MLEVLFGIIAYSIAIVSGLYFGYWLVIELPWLIKGRRRK
jgi:hypothetical protein